MIINIAGTSGSGKSFLMRSFLDWVRKEGSVNEREENGYRIALPTYGTGFIVGKYDVPSGGCDTISDVSAVYNLVRGKLKLYDHVLYEGLFCHNMTRGTELVQEYPGQFHIIQLMTPLAKCMEAINERRAVKGKGALEKTENTIGNYKRAESYCAKMRDSGAKVHKLKREIALPKMLEILGVA